ncbi:Hid-1 family protein P27G11.12 [Schizosaccharomyces pombe]
MGSQQSKLDFRNAVLRLHEERNIPKFDLIWERLWTLPETTEDVFHLMSIDDLTKVKDNAPENLQTIIAVLWDKLEDLQKETSFDDPAAPTTKCALNCMRLLTRLMPIIFEDKSMLEWFDYFAWTVPKDPNINTPRGASFLNTVVDYLFLINFTIPAHNDLTHGVHYCIWETGVVYHPTMLKERSYELHRVEVLRLLLSLFSEEIYRTDGNGSSCCAYVASIANRRLVLCLLSSLINTAMRFNTMFWKPEFLPLDNSVAHMSLIEYCFSVLLILMSEENNNGTPCYNNYRSSKNTLPKNYFSILLSKLQPYSDFQIILDGMSRLLYPPMQSTIPKRSSLIMFDYYPLVLIFCKLFIHYNERFFHYLIDTDRAIDLFIFLLYLSFEYLGDPSTYNHLKLCVILLKRLTAEKYFCKRLNKPFQQQTALPISMPVPFEGGTYADFTIIAISLLVQYTKDYHSEIAQMLCCSLCYLCLYAQNLNSHSSQSLFELFQSASYPGFLISNDVNHKILKYVIGAINNAIQYAQKYNAPLLYFFSMHKDYIEAVSALSFDAIMSVRNSSAEGDSAYWTRNGKTFSSKAFDSILLSRLRYVRSKSPTPYYPIKSSEFGFTNLKNVTSKDEITDGFDKALRSNSLRTHRDSRPVQPLLKQRPQLHRALTESATLHGNDRSLEDTDEAKVEPIAHSVDYTFKPTVEWWNKWWPSLNFRTMLDIFTDLSLKISDMKKAGHPASEIMAMIKTQKYPATNQPYIPKYRTKEWRQQLANFARLFAWQVSCDLDSHKREGPGIFEGTDVKIFNL